MTFADVPVETREDFPRDVIAFKQHGRVVGAIIGVRLCPMKTLNDRIEEYMQRKQMDRLAAVEALLTFALDVIDGRRKGGNTTGNRPQQEKHLARARKVRAK